MKQLALFFSLFFLSTSINAQNANSYFPEKGDWETTTSKAAGFSDALLDSVVNYAIKHEYSGAIDLKVAILKGFEREPYHEILGPTKDRGRPAGIILHKGRILKQWGDVDRVDMTFSVTKSYLSTVAGLAVDDGYFKVDDPVANLIWDGNFDGRHNSKITWRHLLTQSSDWSGELFGGKDWADRPPSEGEIDDWKNRSFNEPGKVFEYNDVRVNLLAYSLLNVLRKPLPLVLKERIMDKIGASPTWRWYGYDHSWVPIDGLQMQSVSGGGHSGGGMFISTLDHARFGLLFQNEGKWKNEQLISSEWIRLAIQPSEANASYGFMWWLNDEKGNRFMEGIDENVYYAAGFGGNFIVIDKQNELVIVTRWLEPRNLKDFLNKVYSAMN
ncbi:serine hydrolase domain-containing protein [Portibacter lacus]|uniref:Serine hydrolase n=1 Tax=Portibacter lacus TaxID=1099794 RepID=A0AA37SM38_9BACT|nr:serine hydrolase [Portibacter lacus]GLR16345.1 serine hydrolase [Portibacter lacus]